MYIMCMRIISALLEAQEIFGLEFDPTEFDQVAREGLGSEDEEEENDVRHYNPSLSLPSKILLPVHVHLYS